MDIVKGNSQFMDFNEEWNDFECDAQLESICEQFSPYPRVSGMGQFSGQFLVGFSSCCSSLNNNTSSNSSSSTNCILLAKSRLSSMKEIDRW